MHLAPFCYVYQAPHGPTVRNRLGQPLCLLLRNKLIARSKQFRQNDEVGIRLFQFGRNNFKIPGHFAELWIELVKPNAHGTLRFI
jgi:hypothetical protein